MRTGPRAPSIRSQNPFGTWQQSVGSAYPAIMPILQEAQQATGFPRPLPEQTSRRCPDGFEPSDDGRCVRRSNPPPQMWPGGPNYGKFDWNMRYGGAYTYAWPSTRQANPCCGCSGVPEALEVAMPAYSEERIDLRSAFERYATPTHAPLDPYTIWPDNIRGACPYGNGQYGLQYSNLVPKSPSLPAAQPGTWPPYAPLQQSAQSTMAAYGVSVGAMAQPSDSIEALPPQPTPSPMPVLPQGMFINTNRSALRAAAIRSSRRG